MAWDQINPLITLVNHANGLNVIITLQDCCDRPKLSLELSNFFAIYRDTLTHQLYHFLADLELLFPERLDQSVLTIWHFVSPLVELQAHHSIVVSASLGCQWRNLLFGCHCRCPHILISFLLRLDGRMRFLHNRRRTTLQLLLSKLGFTTGTHFDLLLLLDLLCRVILFVFCQELVVSLARSSSDEVAISLHLIL